MKNWKKTIVSSAIFVLNAVFFFSIPAVAADDELRTEDGSSVVLQSGGLLPTEELGRAEAPKYLSTMSQEDRPTAKQYIRDQLMLRATQIDISSYGIPEEGLSKFYFSVLNAYPELFFVESTCSYYSSGIYVPGYDSNYTDEDRMCFEEEADQIIAQAPDGMSDKQKLLWIHDYIVTHCEYDRSLSKFDAYNVIVEKTAVCQGYSLAFRYLAGRLGVDAKIVTSDTMKHAWNLVKLDDSYYHIDCTWDDPSNSWYEGYCGHKNFLRSDVQLVEDAGHSGTDWTESDLGNVKGLATSTLYDNYFWHGVTSAIPMANGYYAYVSGSQFIMRKMDESNNASVTLPSGASPWSYSSATTDGENYYYNTSKALYQVAADRSVEKLYDLTDEEKAIGSIYGIVMDDGAIAYNLGTAPCNTVFTRKIYELPQKLFSIVGANMTLGNELSMSFYIPKSSIDENKNYYAKVIKTYADGRDDVTRTFQKSDWINYNSTLYRIIFDGVAAKEMNDKIYVQVFYEDDTAASELWTDSVCDYTVRIFDNQTDKTKRMLADMLNYGSAAQKEFSYDASNLAVNRLSAAQKAYLSTDVSYTDSRVAGENYIGSNLNLGSKLLLSMYFKDVTTDMYAIVSFTSHLGNQVEYRIEGSDFVQQSGSTYRIIIDKLVVADGKQPVTCTVYKANGEVHGSATDNMESYVARMSSTSALYDAIMKFSVSAYQFFHN